MLSIERLKYQARIDDDPSDAGAVQEAIDAELQRRLDSAIEQAEHRTRRTIVSRSRTEYFDSWGKTLALEGPPVQSVVSVNYLDEDGNPQVVAGQNYSLIPHSLVPFVLFSRTFDAPLLGVAHRGISVTYTAGYPADEIPASLEDWILAKAAAGDANRETDSDRPATPVEFYDRLLDAHTVPVI